MDASGVAFGEGKFGSFVLDEKWVNFRSMSSWEKPRFVNSWKLAINLEYRERENNLKD